MPAILIVGLEGLIEVTNKLTNQTSNVNAGQTGKSTKTGITVETTKEEDIPGCRRTEGRDHHPVQRRRW